MVAMTAPGRADTADRITTAMAELMRRQGYAATGVAELARTAEAPTGSIYHHFPDGKRGVAAAALRSTGAAYIQLLPLLLDAHDDLPAAIEAAFATAADTIESTGWATMCPVAVVAAEIADTEPELREVAAEVIAAWIDDGTAYLTARGLTATDARTLIHAVLAALEGAFLMARSLRSQEPLIAAGRSLAVFARGLLDAAARQPT